jgi:hypothetical protein
MLISDKFFHLYTEALTNWDNNVQIFSDFGDHIEQYLEK